MDVNLRMTVRPWIAPNYIVCEIDGKEASIPLSAAGPEAVRHLAQAWLEDVYAKAEIKPDWRFE